MPPFPQGSMKKIPTANVLMPSLPKMKRPSSPLHKMNLIIVGILAVVLIGGFFLFRGERDTAAQEARFALEVAQNFTIQANQALSEKDEARANIMFQRAVAAIEDYRDVGSSSKQAINELYVEVVEQLREINNIMVLENPERIGIVQSDAENLVPKSMFLANGKLYVYNPFFTRVYGFTIATQTSEVFVASRNIIHGVNIAETPVFFAEPNVFLARENNAWTEYPVSLLDEDFQFDVMDSFGQGVYALDATTGSIVQYTDPLGRNVQPVTWLDPDSSEQPFGARAMSIDGNIWVLRDGSMLQRYFKGLHRENVDIVIFPPLEGPTKMKTSALSQHIYVMDPKESRIIVLSKFGEVIWQYQSPQFTDIRDFDVSEDGSVIYVLNGSELYRISTTDHF